MLGWLARRLGDTLSRLGRKIGGRESPVLSVVGVLWLPLIILSLAAVIFLGGPGTPGWALAILCVPGVVGLLFFLFLAILLVVSFIGESVANSSDPRKEILSISSFLFFVLICLAITGALSRCR